MPILKYDGSAAALTAAPTRDYFGTSGIDTLTGTTANESFWGQEPDRMVGGGGDDTYYRQNFGNVFVEAAGGGIDKIYAWSNAWLGDYANIENLTVAADNAYAAGDGADNVIEGQAGAQQLYGGLGQDVLLGGTGADVFIVVKGEGNDAIQDFNVADDVLRLKAGYTTFAQVKAAMTQVGADVRISLGGTDGVILRNTTVESFQAKNFQLELDRTTLGTKTFGDEFSGPLSLWDPQSNPTGTWRPDFGYQGTQGVGSYTLVSNDEKQLYVSPYFRDHNGDFAVNPFTSNTDGTLSIWARPSTNSELFGYQYTSGMISTQPTFSQTYGYFEMRADLPSSAGAWPAFWLIPADGSWPPELDVMETLTSDPHGSWTTWHSANGGHTSNGVLSFVPDTVDGFHTYGLLWTQTDLVWYIDNVEVFRQATPSDLNKPMFMIANLALGGWGGAIDAAALPAEFKLDYIRAYALPGTTATTPTPTPTPPSGDTTSGGSGLSLTSKGYGDVLTGGAGADTLVGSNQGNETLTGGAGADVFRFTAAPWSPSHIKDFVVGNDKLDLSALLQGYTGSDPIADRWLFLFDDGAGGTKVCVDTDGPDATANQWPLYITNLDGVSVTGLTAAKLFGTAVAQPPPPPPTRPAMSDAPSLSLKASAASTTTLNGNGSGNVLNGGSGADLLDGKGGADTMTGGLGDDTYVVDNAGDRVVEAAGGGVDTVRTTLGTYTLAANVENLVMAGTTWQTSIGNAGDNIMTGSKTGSTLNGAGGNDLLISLGGKGDVLAGGAGRDAFRFEAKPTAAGHVTDFTRGQDVLDLRALLGAYNGADPVADGWVRFQQGTDGLSVYIDADGKTGAGVEYKLVTLDGVTSTLTAGADWVF